jgi:hypothetical protein
VPSLAGLCGRSGSALIQSLAARRRALLGRTLSDLALKGAKKDAGQAGAGAKAGGGGKKGGRRGGGRRGGRGGGIF